MVCRLALAFQNYQQFWLLELLHHLPNNHQRQLGSCSVTDRKTLVILPRSPKTKQLLLCLIFHQNKCVQQSCVIINRKYVTGIVCLFIRTGFCIMMYLQEVFFLGEFHVLLPRLFLSTLYFIGSNTPFSEPRKANCNVALKS